MIARISALVVALALSVSFNVFAADDDAIDPEFRDGAIARILDTVRMSGALQPDTTAVEAGANEWSFDVKTTTLSGDTAEEVEASWRKYLAIEKNKILSEMRKTYSEDETILALLAKGLTNEAFEGMSQATDSQALLQEGNDVAAIRTWILDEFATRAGRSNLDFYLEGKNRKKFDLLRFHWHDSSSEVIGYDILIIRGAKKVIKIRFDYAHS